MYHETIYKHMLSRARLLMVVGVVCIGSGAREQVVTTNLELSQQRVSKLEAELDRTKLSLRESREEVQRAARDSMEAVSRSEHRKLLEEVRI